ncbi:sensor histidine kinase [Actinomycetaceae bacterium WB03_NA08]|uniref:histidine kinase n=1 Tax=Scrofimicrobium canadense TaxID=2652290 RepID=A0A6N7W7D1_9ACTO|nr:histidine kinase [Scrofimicrobium canadense]MSS84342.1 sensor histidine kinase [Scrofimicrobium canadense]
MRKISRLWRQVDDRPRLRDALIALCYAILGSLFLAFGLFPIWQAVAVFSIGPWGFFALLCGMSVICAARSTYPISALGAGTVLAVVDVLCGGSIGVIVIYSDMVFSAIKYSSDRAVRVLFTCMLSIAVIMGIVFIVFQPANLRIVPVILQYAFIVAIATAWGWNVRSEGIRTRDRLTQDHLRTIQSMQKRIAHDLHDLVANHIAAASLHIEAGRMQVTQSPSQVGNALDQAAKGTHEADRQLRRLIAILNAVEVLETSHEAPTRHQIEELSDRLPLSRTLLWQESSQEKLLDGLSALPDPLQHLTIRVLQELITNASKYGTGNIEITAGSTPSAMLEISVRNYVAKDNHPTSGSGIGLAGARMLLEGTAVTLDSRYQAAHDQWVATIAIPRSYPTRELRNHLHD